MQSLIIDCQTGQKSLEEVVRSAEEIAASQEELALAELENAETLEKQKRNTFAEEADPLFFKAQRGEATMDEWLAKVAEIKARFANPA